MLEPRDRMLLFEALRPPEGFRFDQGFGTTYTLDLLALLTAPVAFTWFEQSDEDQRSGVNSLEVLESLRRHADRLTIFCHAGRIALPKTAYPQLAFVENSIVECQPVQGGAFHPKVWVLRWMNDARDVRYRVLCLSRNLTFSRAWDTLLSLDGPLLSDRRAAVGRNRGLVEFVRTLPGLATRKPVNTLVTQRVETLAAELERTKFELPDGITDLRFWPLGIGARDRDPLAEVGDRLLVVSPFITLGRLEDLAKGRSDVTLVSTSNALAHLTRRPEGVKQFYSLTERAMLESDTEREGARESEAEAIELSDLHAKLFVRERGWDAHIWTGSANATAAAFGGNVEFLVELTGPRKRFGIDALMEPQKGEVRFVNLLTDAGEFVAQLGTEPTEALRVLSGDTGTLLSRDDVSAYRQLDPGNARIRNLVRDMLDSEAWRLLWMPPSWQYHAPAGEFALPAIQRLTKRLIFSSWQVVPRVVAALLTYEAERRMLGIGPEGEPDSQGPEARKRRRGLLRFSVSDGRLTGMPVLGLLYPSFVLAAEADPRIWAPADAVASIPTMVELLEQTRGVCKRLLKAITRNAPNDGDVDERWYWAAPLLLDLDRDPARAAAWLGQRCLQSY